MPPLPKYWVFQLVLAVIAASVTVGATWWAVAKTLGRDRTRFREELDRQRQLRQEERTLEALEGLRSGVVTASAAFTQEWGQRPRFELAPDEVIRDAVAALANANNVFLHRVDNWEVTERMHRIRTQLNASAADVSRGDTPTLLPQVDQDLFSLRIFLESLIAGEARPDVIGDPPARTITNP